MKNKFKILFSLITIIIFSCESEKKEQLELADNIEEIPHLDNADSLIFTEINLEFAGTILNIYELKNWLVFCDIGNGTNQVFHIYDKSDLKYIQSVIGKGAGPEEAISPLSNGLLNSNLWVHDVTQNKVISFSINDNNEKINLNTYKIKDNYLWGAKIFEEKMAFVGDLTKYSKVQVVDLESGELEKEIGSYTSIPASYNEEIVQQVGQTIIKYNESKNSIILFYRFFDAIEIIDLEDNNSSVISFNEISPDFMVFNTDLGKVLERTEKTRQGFIFGELTKEYIYGLFSGKYFTEESPTTSNIIYKYDFEGNLIKKYLSNLEINNFSILEDGKTIYTFNQENGKIYKSILK